jgi:uncharacterized flavoprotein (TIGR03862 family)
MTQANLKSLAIIGGGPAGLMAAEVLSNNGIQVDLFDAMPSVGRKFLMAGKGGMNITHSEPAEAFHSRYGVRSERLAPLLNNFGPESIRRWMDELGISSFIGSSGRVFPSDMKAAPLLRAWLQRLRGNGVRFHVRHRWCGLESHQNGQHLLHFVTPDGANSFTADAIVLATGGASWPKLGSDGRWVALLEQAGVTLAPFRPANCGFDSNWSAFLREHFAGQPVKPVVATFTDSRGTTHQRQGEFVLTSSGVEGGLIYALSAPLRDAIEQTGQALLFLDLLPGHESQRVIDEVSKPRGSRSISSHLQSRLGLKGVKMALLNERLSRDQIGDPLTLARTIKALPLQLIAPRPLEEAISSAGGVVFEALDQQLMIKTLPGVFCAGEMLDWEAPTGGYLLTGCLASGHAAGQGALNWIRQNHANHR